MLHPDVSGGVPDGILAVTQGAVREAVFVGLPETDVGTAAGGSADQSSAERTSSLP